jgi:hypothetical protein
MRTGSAALAASFAVCSPAQIPDLLNALDAGGRAMGTGGATSVTDANTLSTYHNPAGLAYVGSSTFSVAMRTLPESSSRLTGSFTDPNFETDEFVGARRLTHFGVAMPMRGGTLGLSYTMGGYIREDRLAGNLTNGLTNVRNYVELLQAQVDYFTVAYGRRAGSANLGVGVVLANRYLKNTQRYGIFDASNNNIGNVNVDVAGSSNGVGLIAGAQFSSPNNPNTVVGASVRTPIKLNGGVRGYFDTLPGRASLGVAQRTQGRREDFLVFGAQADWYSGGDKGGIIPRKDVLALGAGFEYNYHRWNSRFPIRLGYQSVPSGGAGFGSRDALSFGFGYRPGDQDFGIDLSFAAPSGGGRLDTGLSITYKVSK